MNNIELLMKTPPELNKDVADRLRAIRKKQKLSQEQLSKKSGVSLGSVKRFESTGNISFLSLTKIAMALGESQAIEALFSEPRIHSIQDIIDGN